MANYSGEGHARRDAIARAKGFKSYYDYRKAPKHVRDSANAAYEAAHPTYKATGGRKQSAQAAQSQTRRQRLVKLGPHRETIDSMRNRELWAFIKRAARAALARRDAVRVVVFASVTFECVDAEGTTSYHRVDHWPNYGYTASHAMRDVRQFDPEGDPPDVVGWLRANSDHDDTGAVAVGEGDSAAPIGPECEVIRVQMTAETKSRPREAAA